LADPAQEEPVSGREPAEEPALIWTASDAATTIRFSAAVIEQIRSEVVRALHGMGRGGIEAGGLLLGKCEDDNYLIDAWRPIRCDHSRGSSFLLSDRDVATLSCQIEAVQVDPLLEGRRVVGWFVSHTRGGLAPRIEESQVHMRHFDATGSLLLTIQPSRSADAEAIIHIYEHDEPPSLVPLDPPLPILPAPGANGPSGQSTDPAPPKLPWLGGPDQAPPERSFRKRWLPWVAGSAGLAFIAFSVFTVRAQRRLAQEAVDHAPPVHIEPSGPPRPLLSVHLNRASDSIEITWDTSTAALAGARSGILTVLDRGATFSRNMTANELKLGRIDYTRSQGEIRVRLSVDTAAGRLTEDAHYEPFRLPSQSR